MPEELPQTSNTGPLSDVTADSLRSKDSDFGDVTSSRIASEIRSFERAHEEVNKYATERERTLLKSLRQDIKARKKYATNIFRLIVWWLLAISAVIFFQGFLSDQTAYWMIGYRGFVLEAFPKFRLSDPVLLALIGGTTASVLGLFVIVVRYLFPNRNNSTGDA